MGKKILAVIGFFVVTALLFYYGNIAKMKSRFTVQPMGDNKGIFVGEKQSTIDGPSDYAKQVKAIDDAWDNIELGNSHSKARRYEDAVTAYEKAYNIGGGARAVSGFKLVEIYEKLGRYDEAIALLDQMIQKRQLSELGIQDAQENKSRLLVAKSQNTIKESR